MDEDDDITVMDETGKIQTDVDVLMEKLCDICAKNPWKYRCPGCGARTCSLLCCQEHKVSLACTGEKDPTKFIPVSKYGNLDLASDFRFLENAGRAAEKSKQTSQQTPEPESPKPSDGTRRQFPLSKACNERKIRLEFQPKGLERSSHNQSEYNSGADTIFWTVELIFVSTHGEVPVRVHRIPETLRLKTLCSQILSGRSRKQGLLEILEEVSEKLESFQSLHSGMDTLMSYQKIERCPAKFGKKFEHVDLDQSIRQNLCERTVIEYPSFHVVAPYRLNLDDTFPLPTPEQLEEIRQLPNMGKSPQKIPHKNRQNTAKRNEKRRARFQARRELQAQRNTGATKNPPDPNFKEPQQPMDTSATDPNLPQNMGPHGPTRPFPRGRMRPNRRMGGMGGGQPPWGYRGMGPRGERGFRGRPMLLKGMPGRFRGRGRSFPGRGTAPPINATDREKLTEKDNSASKEEKSQEPKLQEEILCDSRFLVSEIPAEKEREDVSTKVQKEKEETSKVAEEGELQSSSDEKDEKGRGCEREPVEIKKKNYLDILAEEYSEFLSDSDED